MELTIIKIFAQYSRRIVDDRVYKQRKKHSGFSINSEVFYGRQKILRVS